MIRGVFTLAWVLLLLGLASAQVTLQQSITGAGATPLAAELNSLANNAYSAASAPQSNLIGGTGNGALLCEFELYAVFGGIPTPETALQAWLLSSLDGTNYETAWNTGGTIGPGRGPDLTLPVAKGQTETRVRQILFCPPGLYKVQVLNQNTGQALAASGNTVRVRYITLRGQ